MQARYELQEMGDHYHRLTVVPGRHHRFPRRVPRAHRREIAAEKLVRRHREVHILVPAAPDVEHLAGGKEAKHPVLSLEVPAWHLKVHLEAEIRIGTGVRKEGRETHAVAHSEVVVDHGRPGVHPNLSEAHLQGELIVDVNSVAMLQKGDHVLVPALVHGLELGKLQRVWDHVDKFVFQVGVDRTTNDLIQDVGLRGELVIRVDGKFVRDGGDVGRHFGRFGLRIGEVEAAVDNNTHGCAGEMFIDRRGKRAAHTQ